VPIRAGNHQLLKMSDKSIKICDGRILLPPDSVAIMRQSG